MPYRSSIDRKNPEKDSMNLFALEFVQLRDGMKKPHSFDVLPKTECPLARINDDSAGGLEIRATPMECSLNTRGGNPFDFDRPPVLFPHFPNQINLRPRPLA